MNKAIKEIQISLEEIQKKQGELFVKERELLDKLNKLENKEEEKTNFKIWKKMEGKYYHVWLFTIPEEDKFKRCLYVHVLKVEKNLLEYEYINYDEKCMFITTSTFDHIHSRGYKEWTEITKKEYEKIIFSTKNLERIK